MLGCTLVFIVGSVLGTILLYIFFTTVKKKIIPQPPPPLFILLCLLQMSTCTLNKVFISINLILGAGVVIMSILPFVQKGKYLECACTQCKVLSYCHYLLAIYKSTVLCIVQVKFSWCMNEGDNK